MPKLSESQIRAAISAREKEARADSELLKAMLTRMRAGRRQGEKALTAHLKKTGFDFEAYNRIRAQQQAEMQRLLTHSDAAAIRLSRSRAKALASGIANWRSAARRCRPRARAFATPPACPHSSRSSKSWRLRS